MSSICNNGRSARIVLTDTDVLMPRTQAGIVLTCMAGFVLTCMDALMPRAHGSAGAAYNPLHFLHPWRSDALSENLLRQALSASTGWVCRRRARGSVSLVTWSRAILGAAPYGRAKKARAQFCSRQNCLVADKTNLTGSNLDRRRRPVGRGPGKVRVKVTRVRATDRDVGR